jgi:hypothetical protein
MIYILNRYSWQEKYNLGVNINVKTILSLYIAVVVFDFLRDYHDFD